jgi:hypothetical protein
VSQQVPWKSTLEIEYQGNRTRNALLAGNGANIQFYPNINKIPLGALFGSNPVTGENRWVTSCGTDPTKYKCNVGTDGTYQAQFRPYLNYNQALDVNSHGSYSNYNAMMVSWQKQRGPVTFIANYTWSKVMGIRDGQTNNGNGDGQINDAFNLRNNYAPLGYDHTHIFNVAYVVHLPNRIHGNAFLEGVANGWELAGISQVQSGAPIQANSNGDLNASYNGVSDTQVFGTTGQRLLPIVICDPRSGLKSGQYFNPNCFTSPIPAHLDASGTFVPGINGKAVWPYIHGPAYMNNDISLYKNFKIGESKGVQFRVNAFNFLNHPLRQFGLYPDLNLNLGQPIQDGAGGFIVPKSCTVNGPACNQYDTTKNVPHTDGTVQGKVGRRVMEFAVKFTF